MIMCIQNLVSICLFFLKILSKNQILTSIKAVTLLQICEKQLFLIPIFVLVNDINVYTKYGINRSIRFEDIEQKLNSDDNQGP